MENKLTRLLNIKHPLIVAPMAGGPSSVSLVSICSSNGALGSIGAAYSSPLAIREMVSEIRKSTNKAFGINLFIPTNISDVSKDVIQLALDSTAHFRKDLNIPSPVVSPPYEENFDHQFEEVLRAKPQSFSFIFGLLGSEYIKALKKENIVIMGTATSPEEALSLSESSVDAIVLQGVESGGHRGLFSQLNDDPCISTIDLLNTVLPKIKIPLIAAGGIMNKSDIKKMLSAGAMSVQMGTAFLAVEEAGTSIPYKRALLESDIRKTKTTRAFSGRLARGLINTFMVELDNKPESILPFPIQNTFTRDIRNASTKKDRSEYLSLWSGSGHGKLSTGSAKDLIRQLFD